MEGTFSWAGQITVRAMRYRFPGVHRVLTALVVADRFYLWVMVSPTQLLTVIAQPDLYYRDGQQVDRYMVQESPDGPSTTPSAPRRNRAPTIRRADYGHRRHLPALFPGCVSVSAGPDPLGDTGRGAERGDFLQGSGRPEELIDDLDVRAWLFTGGPQLLLFPLPHGQSILPRWKLRDAGRRYAGHCPAAGRSGCRIYCASVPARAGRAL